MGHFYAVHRFVATDIQCPQNYRAIPVSHQDLLVCLKLLVFRRQCISPHVQEFGAEETNTICISGIGKALVVCRSNIQFYRNSNAVRGNGLAINI